MEERERLCRQIRLLQGLINDHKNAHGDAPRTLSSVPPRWNNPRQPSFSRRGAFSARYPQQAPRDFQLRQGHSWRKKYSLVNRPSGSVCDIGSGGSASTSGAFGSHGDGQTPEPPESSPERHVDLTTDGNIVVGIQLPQRAGPFVDTEGFGDVGSYCEFSGLKTMVTAPGNSKNVTESLYASQNEERRPSLSVSFSSSHRFVSSAYVSVSGKPRTVRLASDVTGSSSLSCGSSSESAITLKSEPQQPLVLPDHELAQHLVRKKAEPPAPGQASCEQVRDAFREPKVLGNGKTCSRPTQTTTLVVGMSPMKSRFSVVPKAPGLQRAASASVSNKALKFRKTNYTWVANPGKCSRTVKRWISPRASESAKKVAGGTDRGAKLSPKADLGAKLKKSGLQSKLGVSPSKYKWKASSLQTSPSTSKSAFRWRSEDQKKPPAPNLPQAGVAPPPLSAASVGLSGAKSTFNEAAALSSYKVKSRTKIIKRKGSLSSPTDKKNNSSPTTPLKSHFQLRKKNSRGKSSMTLKRSSPKGLVQITKHRLCRLPATRMQVSTKEGDTCTSSALAWESSWQCHYSARVRSSPITQLLC
ncbi:zinc finger CCCH domain-containing protein 3-like isoform 3-T10 [Alca torda]